MPGFGRWVDRNKVKLFEEGGRTLDHGRCLIECMDANIPILPPQKKMLIHGDRLVSRLVTDHRASKKSKCILSNVRL